MRQFLLALQFLTILPIRLKGNITEDTIAKASAFFVVVGLLQGMFLLAVLNLAEGFFHPELTIFLVITVSVLCNGGFHIDGLSDTFDAFAVKSTGDNKKDIEKRLTVMKDSSTGAIGVTAIVFVVMIKFLSLKNISHLIPSIYYSSVLLMPVMSKWTMTVAMFHGRPARQDGLGRLFINGMTIKEFLFSTATLIVIFALIYISFSDYLPRGFILFYSFLIVIVYLITIIWLYLCNKRFNGLTGDTLGALNEITEIIFLLGVVIWSRHFFS